MSYFMDQTKRQQDFLQSVRHDDFANEEKHQVLWLSAADSAPRPNFLERLDGGVRATWVMDSPDGDPGRVLLRRVIFTDLTKDGIRTVIDKLYEPWAVSVPTTSTETAIDVFLTNMSQGVFKRSRKECSVSSFLVSLGVDSESADSFQRNILARKNLASLSEFRVELRDDIVDAYGAAGDWCRSCMTGIARYQTEIYENASGRIRFATLFNGETRIGRCLVVCPLSYDKASISDWRNCPPDETERWYFGRIYSPETVSGVLGSDTLSLAMKNAGYRPWFDVPSGYGIPMFASDYDSRLPYLDRGELFSKDLRVWWALYCGQPDAGWKSHGNTTDGRLDYDEEDDTFGCSCCDEVCSNDDGYQTADGSVCCHCFGRNYVEAWDGEYRRSDECTIVLLVGHRGWWEVQYVLSDALDDEHVVELDYSVEYGGFTVHYAHESLTVTYEDEVMIVPEGKNRDEYLRELEAEDQTKTEEAANVEAV